MMMETLRIGTAGDVVELVPYVIGFTPEESLVVMVIQNGRSAVTARVNIADVLSQPALDDLIRRMWDRYPGSSGWVLGISENRDVAKNIADRAAAAVRLMKPGFVRSTVVTGGRWYDDLDGTGVVATSGRVSRAAKEAGLAPVGSREDLKRRLTPAEPAPIEWLDGLIEKLPEDEDDVTSLLIGCVREALTGGLNAELATSMSIMLFARDATRAALLAVDAENAGWWLDLWTQVVRLTGAPWVSFPLLMAAHAAWVSGDGATAAAALEIVETIRPRPEFHPMIAQLLEDVVPPQAWVAVRKALVDEVDVETLNRVADLMAAVWEARGSRTNS